MRGDGIKVFVTRRLPEVAMKIVERVANVEVWEEDRAVPREILEEKITEIDGLLCLLTDRIDSTLLDRSHRLKIVSQMAVGYDNIDVKSCAERGIAVGNTPGALTETTADFAFALLLATARRLTEGERFLRGGDWKTWSPMALTGLDVHHATIGIIGMGRIGFEMARRAYGFRMKVLYASRSRHLQAETEFGATFLSLEEALSQSDFVSLHTPLTQETRSLIGANELRQMKPTAILINTARGQIVDQVALTEALRCGIIAGAGLDVFETEPLPTDDPLLLLSNVVLAPHIGSASIATRTRMAVLAAENLVAGVQGLPIPNQVK